MEENKYAEMSHSGDEIQEPRGDQQKRKDRWKKGIIDKINRTNLTKSVTMYNPQTKKTIKGEICIYRVPDKLRQVQEDAYHPRVVSIGPFHRDTHNLEAMKQYKWSYMVSLFQQSKDQEDTEASWRCLEACINVIYGLDEMIRQCYAEKINCTEDELAEIMLVDGCFILELFLRFDRSLNYMKLEDFEIDPVLKSPWMITALQHDLGLLENQIPFFILELLYDTIRPHVIKREPPKSVTSLALKFFPPMSQKSIEKEQVAAEFKHLLDLLHQFYYLPAAATGAHDLSIEFNDRASLISEIEHSSASPCSRELDDQETNKSSGFSSCASELLESGIELQVGSSTEDQLLEITFSEGVIRIPQVYIHETAPSVLCNLVVFEQCSISSTHGVTAFAFLMESLIRSTRDINLLTRKKIFRHNWIGSQEYSTEFRNTLKEVVTKNDSYFATLYKEVNDYRKSYQWSRLQVFLRVQYQRQRGILCTTYFSTTWKVISLLVAVTFLLLSAIQTYYTINPHH
ncbi:UPF0481 protein [Rosa sericea]